MMFLQIVQGGDHGGSNDVALLGLHIRIDHDSIRQMVRMKFDEGHVVAGEDGELDRAVAISVDVISGAGEAHLVQATSKPLKEVCFAQRRP